MKNNLSNLENQEHPHGNLKSYTIGFVLSIVLTIIPYKLVVDEALTGWNMIYLLLAFAVTQLAVQAVFFLHLSREAKPRWNQTVFAFMLLVVLILVIGSLWIMRNLNYHSVPIPDDQEIIKDEGY